MKFNTTQEEVYYFSEIEGRAKDNLGVPEHDCKDTGCEVCSDYNDSRQWWLENKQVKVEVKDDTNNSLLSSCCVAGIYDDTDICKECKEHCGAIDEVENKYEFVINKWERKHYEL